MNKRLKKLLWPGLWVFFLFMAAFAVMAAAMGQYLIAGTEAAVTVLLLAYYLLSRNHRRKGARVCPPGAYGSSITHFCGKVYYNFSKDGKLGFRGAIPRM